MPETEAKVRLDAWHDTARWVAYVAAEWVSDQTTRSYLEHVATCIRDEGERRYSALAGFTPALSRLD